MSQENNRTALETLDEKETAGVCRTCKYFSLGDFGEEECFGECLRYPPQPNINELLLSAIICIGRDTQQQANTIRHLANSFEEFDHVCTDKFYIRPVVHHSDWCGEWAAIEGMK